jgi:hypothetical protein
MASTPRPVTPVSKTVRKDADKVKSKNCGFCGDALTDENITNEDERVCRLCFRYAVFGTGYKCRRCDQYYEDCTCPCGDCGEPADTCYCRMLAEPVKTCLYCDCDPCVCVEMSELEEHARKEASTQNGAARCICGVKITGDEGWGGYCSRHCASGWDDYEHGRSWRD